MKITEFDNYPVKYDRFIVYPEYYTDLSDVMKDLGENHFFKQDVISVIGVGKSFKDYTSVVISNGSHIIGMRYKISIFSGEDSKISTKLEAFDVGDFRVGIVICREVLHTAIAEIYRMMKVNIVTVHVGGGEFYGMQRASWIDQMSLFSDIVQCPLICASGATREEGGINLIIER